MRSSRQPAAAQTSRRHPDRHGLDQTLTNRVVLRRTPAINVLHAYNFTTNVLTTEGRLRLTNVVSGPGK